MIATHEINPPALQDVLDVYVECGGVTPLVIEKLNKSHNTNCPLRDNCQEHDIMTEAKLTNLLASQLSKLQDMVRAKTIMDTYYATQLAITTAISKMTYLDPFEASKTATNFIQKLSELTDRRVQNTSNINLSQTVYEQLSPQQQEAWVFLQRQRDSATTPGDSTPTIIEHLEA